MTQAPSNWNYLGSTFSGYTSNGLCAVRVEYLGPQDHPWHSHETSSIYIHLRGRHKAGFKEGYFLQPRLSILYYPGGQPHSSRAPVEGMGGLNVEISGGWADRHVVQLEQRRRFGIDVSPNAGVNALRLMAALRSGSQDAVDDAMLECLEPFFSVRSAELAKKPQWLQRAEQFIHESFRGPIGLTAISREVAIDPIHLAKVFRAWHGMSTGEYLHRLRVVDATDRVLNGGATLSEAASASGFSDQAHMTRLVRRYTDLMPKSLKEWRQGWPSQA